MNFGSPVVGSSVIPKSFPANRHRSRCRHRRSPTIRHIARKPGRSDRNGCGRHRGAQRPHASSLRRRGGRVHQDPQRRTSLRIQSVECFANAFDTKQILAEPGATSPSTLQLPLSAVMSIRRSGSNLSGLTLSAIGAHTRSARPRDAPTYDRQTRGIEAARRPSGRSGGRRQASPSKRVYGQLASGNPRR